MDNEGETIPQNELLEGNIDILGENGKGEQQRCCEDNQRTTHSDPLQKNVARASGFN
jgi:hypothetical protein